MSPAPPNTDEPSTPPSDGGRFVTFEGVEGSGKSTQLARLAERLVAEGRQIVVTREPGATKLGARLRSLLLDPRSRGLAPRAELLLYVADRLQHLAEIIEPALAAGRLVLCDRYLDATIAYQGYGRALGADHVRALHRAAGIRRLPHRTLLFDVEPELGLSRARERDARSGVAVTEGRFEQEHLEFHRRVREGYLALAAAEPRRFVVIDASGDPLDIERRVHAALVELVPALAEKP